MNAPAMKLQKLFLHLRSFALPIVIVVFALIVQATTLQDSLDWQRSQIDAGQWWLIISGHFTHLGWEHFLLNCLALLIIWELFYRHRKVWLVVVELLWLCLVVGLGIYLFNPDVEWYVGLSGILHGMFLIGLSSELHWKNKIGLIVAVGFAAKIVWEQNVGITTGLIFEEDSVLVDAHLYGTLGGLIVALPLELIKRKKLFGSQVEDLILRR